MKSHYRSGAKVCTSQFLLSHLLNSFNLDHFIRIIYSVQQLKSLLRMFAGKALFTYNSFYLKRTTRPTLSFSSTQAMAEEGAAGGGGAPATAVAGEEPADTGFYNRKLHNYPLIKVGLLAGAWNSLFSCTSETVWFSSSAVTSVAN